MSVSADTVMLMLSASITVLRQTYGVRERVSFSRRHRDGPRGSRKASQVRRQAIYLLVTEGNVRQTEIARALGLYRQDISQIVHRTEDERDDPMIDALLDSVGQQWRRLLQSRSASRTSSESCNLASMS